MATSGIINGTASQRPDRYFPKLFWQDVSPSQNWRIENNASVIRVYSLVESDGSTFDWNGTCSAWAMTVTGHAPRTLTNFNSNTYSGWTYPSGWSGVTSKKTELIPETGSTYQDFTVYHNPDGALSVSVSHSYSLPSGSYGPGNVSISGTITLDTIPRASVLTSFNNFTMNGSNLTLNVYATSYYAGFNLDFVLKVGTTTVATFANRTPVVGSGKLYQLPLTTAEQTMILNTIESSMSATVTITLTTQSGSTNIGSVSSLNATAYVGSNIKPTLGGVTHAEATTNPAIATIVGKYVKNLSTIKFTLTGATAYSGGGATIAGYRINYLGVNYEQAGNIFTTAPISWTNSGTITAYVKDSRGVWSNGVVLSALTALDYSKPNISLGGAERYLNSSGTLDDEGTYLGVKISSTVKSLVNGTEKNKAYLQIRIRQIAPTVGSWVVVRAKSLVANTLTNQMYGYWGTYAITSSFEVESTLYDELNQTHVVVDTVSTTKVIMDWDDVGVGIGKTRTNGVLDIEGDVYVSGNLLQGGNVRALFHSIAIVPDGEDLNSYLQPGMYYCDTNARATTFSNCPTNLSFSLLVEKHAGIKQTLTEYKTASIKTWVRNYYDGTWGDWRLVFDDSSGKSLVQTVKKGYGASTIISETLDDRSLYALFTGTAGSTISFHIISTDSSSTHIRTIHASSSISVSASGFNLTATSTYSVAYCLLKLV